MFLESKISAKRLPLLCVVVIVAKAEGAKREAEKKESVLTKTKVRVGPNTHEIVHMYAYVYVCVFKIICCSRFAQLYKVSVCEWSFWDVASV